jgi:hypothetical protein
LASLRVKMRTLPSFETADTAVLTKKNHIPVEFCIFL